MTEVRRSDYDYQREYGEDREEDEAFGATDLLLSAYQRLNILTQAENDETQFQAGEARDALCFMAHALVAQYPELGAELLASIEREPNMQFDAIASQVRQGLNHAGQSDHPDVPR